MRTQYGFSTMFFALALVLAVSSTPVAAQITPVANGFGLRYLNSYYNNNFVATDGFDGFCSDSSLLKGTSEVDLLSPDGQQFLLADQQKSFNSGHGGPRTYFATTQNGITRGGHACGLNNMFVLAWSDLTGAATLYSQVLGAAPVYGSLQALATPGQPFNYSDGFATYLDGYTITANYGRIILTGKFDRGSGPETLAFEIFAGTPPRLLATLGTDQAISAVQTISMAYITLISPDHTSERVMAVPTTGATFQVAELDGLATSDLNATPYAARQIAMATNHSALILSVSDPNRSVIQILTDSQTVPVTVLDTVTVNSLPVGRISSIAITEGGDTYFVQRPSGNYDTIYHLDQQGYLLQVMRDGLDMVHAPTATWSVVANAYRVFATTGQATYEILPPM